MLEEFFERIGFLTPKYSGFFINTYFLNGLTHTGIPLLSKIFNFSELGHGLYLNFKSLDATLSILTLFVVKL